MIEAPLLPTHGVVTAANGPEIQAAGVAIIKRPKPAYACTVDRDVQVETPQGVVMARAGGLVAFDPEAKRVFAIGAEEADAAYELDGGGSEVASAVEAQVGRVQAEARDAQDAISASHREVDRLNAELAARTAELEQRASELSAATARIAELEEQAAAAKQEPAEGAPEAAGDGAPPAGEAAAAGGQG